MIDPTANMCKSGGEQIKIALARAFLDEDGHAYNVPSLWCIETARKVYEAMERLRVQESS